MIAISLTFSAGRYHATPWGRHVNEGAVEWPPSPWRLLRSLIAVWKRTLPEIHEADIKPIFEALAATPPHFVLPRASTGHTRHYMPWYKKGPTDRTLVFDAFVALDPCGAAVHAIWPDAVLDAAQRELLARLLANLNYLGRAESWCDARLLPDDQAAAILDNEELIHASPLDSAVPSNQHRDMELVRTLCPDPREAFMNSQFSEQRQIRRGRSTRTESVRTANPSEPDWHLAAETLWLHAQHWSDPPGTKWVTYIRPRNCFEVTTPFHQKPIRGPAVARSIHIARFALDSAVLPLVTDTLPVAEAARRALMSIFGRLTEADGVRGRSPILAGKDEHGRPLLGHRHAYFLPTDEDNDGRLDHLTVYAADGFGPNECRAIERLKNIRHDSPHPLRVLLLSTSPADRAMPHDRSLLACSRVWVSATPYLVTRHPKTRGPRKLDLADPDARDRFLREDLIAQIRASRDDLADVIDQVRVQPLTDAHARYVINQAPGSSRGLRPLQFKRFRSKRNDDGGQRLAGAFQITFPHPVRGPLALGHSSHFGMGLFLPASTSGSHEYPLC